MKTKTIVIVAMVVACIGFVGGLTMVHGWAGFFFGLGIAGLAVGLFAPVLSILDEIEKLEK